VLQVGQIEIMQAPSILVLVVLGEIRLALKNQIEPHGGSI